MAANGTYGIHNNTTPLRRLLLACWKHRVMLSSDLARELSTAVGIAASCGYITTRCGGIFCRQWLVTRRGLEWLDRELGPANRRAMASKRKRSVG